MGTGQGEHVATHLPVLAERWLDLLGPALSVPGSVYVDGTLGLGGHAALILEACPHAGLIGIDRDPQALRIAGERLARFGDRVRLVNAVYHELPQVLERVGLSQVQAIGLDLGLSSLQIDQAERGFAYSQDAPLDMRMNPEFGRTAADLLNQESSAELARLFRIYGEERNAKRIAAAIVAARTQEEFTNSARLVQVIQDSLPAAARAAGRGHPAKRVFQALRIVVNAELDSLQGVLPAALDALAPGGRLAVLAYHSGEDRLVKRAFAAASSDQVPAGVPAVPQAYQARFTLLTRGAERPTAEEISDNSRAASARLRAISRNLEVSR